MAQTKAQRATPEQRTAHRLRGVRHRQEKRAFVEQSKCKPCERCGLSFPAVCMDLHHRDPSTKLFGVASGLIQHSYAELSAEIAKCAILCACCHRLIHEDLKQHGAAKKLVV